MSRKAFSYDMFGIAACLP